MTLYRGVDVKYGPYRDAVLTWVVPVGEPVYRYEPAVVDGHWHDVGQVCRCGLFVQTLTVVKIGGDE